MKYDVYAVRQQFPALFENFTGQPAIFFDNPGGTQVPQKGIDAMSNYLIRANANCHSAFSTSRRTELVIEQARKAGADLLGAEPNEIVFGNNMTSLTFQLSRALAPTINPGDEIILSRLDHDANITPWLQMAQEREATVRWAEVNLETCTLDMDYLQSLVNPRTKLIAVGYASNACGTINDVARIVQFAKAYNAYTFIDAVHYAPHGLIDVKQLDCDFLVCSAYKFFGPHVGLLYGKEEHLARLSTDRVRPASSEPPESWEIGTKNHEGLAGMTAAIDYLADLGVLYGDAPVFGSRRAKLRITWQEIQTYEQTLIDYLISGLRTIPGIRIYGITNLAERNIFAWHGNMYALELSQRLGVESSGGFLRLGLVHYNTTQEIDHCLNILEDA